MTPMRTLWPFARLAMAATIAAAAVAQLVRSVGNAHAAHQNVAITAVNFFSFFTILSNVLTLAVFVWAAAWSLTHRHDEDTEPPWVALSLVSVTTYMLITGIVYNILLRGISQPPGTTVAWSNNVLHVVAPAFLLVDLLVAPRRRSLAWRAIAQTLAFPVAWIVYSLVRAPLVTNPVSGQPWWYPYPFLDPHNFANGFGTVAVYIAGIAVVITVVAWLCVWVGRWRGTPVS